MSSKFKSLSIVMITFIVLLLAGCNNNAVNFEIKFDSNGGTNVESININSSSEISLPDDPIKDGYIFDGWYWDNETFEFPFTINSILDTPLQENITVYARWTTTDNDIPAESVKVIFSTADVLPDVIKYIKPGSILAIPEIEAPGYTIEGWYTSINGGATLDERWSFTNNIVNTDITLYANLLLNEITIKFNSNGGSLIPSITQVYNSEVTKPQDPVKEGYTFDGWDQPFPSNMPSEDITLNARWSINQYTMTFDSNEGTTVTAITQNYNTVVTAPSEPTRTGYTFEGWYVDEDYTQAYAFIAMPAEDIIIYAKWALANPIYNLVDENFRSKILDFFISQQLDFNHNGIIDYDELPGITWIDASDGEIVSLEGIEIFSNLETIYLSNNSIEDISPLLQVAKLKNLVIGNNYLGTSPFRLIDQDDIDNINMLKEKGVNTFNTEKEQKVDFNNELSIQENIATWRMLVVIVPEINTVDNLGTPVYYEMTDVEIEVAKEYARMSAIVMDVLLEYKVHFDVDIYISTTPYTGELIANADNIIFATQIDEVSNLLQNYDTTLLITSLPNIDNSHEYSIYHSASGYGSFDIEKNIGTSMMYLDSNLYGYVINNIPFERELIRLQNNSILSTIWLPVHEIIHTIEYYSISKGYITWEFHNAIVQYGHSIDNWMYYDIYNPYLNGSKNPENNVEFGIVEEIWINPPGLEERD